MTSQRVDFTDLLKWSLNHQDQFPKDTSESPYVPRQLSEEDQRFLLDAMDNNVMDEQKRVKVLLQVMRLPSDPNLLYAMEHLDGSANSSSIKPLQDKESLRTLLEMRQEDDQRKRLGLDNIGMEYIPGNVLEIEEILKKRLMLSLLSSLPALEDDVKSSLGDQYDVVDGEKKMEVRKEVKQKRLDSTLAKVQELLPSHIQSTLSAIKTPTNTDLKEVYNRIREQKLDTLEEIEDRTHRGDNAVGFVSFNGLPIMKQYLLSHDYEVAAEAWRLLGGIVSNQPFCQQKALEYNLIPLAIEALNLARYIPSLLAAHIYSSHELVDSFQPRASLAKERYGEQMGLSLAPSFKPSNIALSPDQFQALMKQYAPADLEPKDYPQWLYQHTHFGQTYIKALLPMLKSVLYFISSICNNNSTAQTQFILHHGMIPLSHLLQLGHYHIKQSQEPDEQSSSTPTTPSGSKSPSRSPATAAKKLNSTGSSQVEVLEVPEVILSETASLLISFLETQGSTFKQILRRVFQLTTLLVDDEYKVTTSGEICGLIFKNVLAYAELFGQNGQNGAQNDQSQPQSPAVPVPGSDILTFIPKSKSTRQPMQPNALAAALNTTSSASLNADEGHARVYFQDPVAPLMVENTEEIHPAFKLKSNLAGGKVNAEGMQIETQFYLSPFASLLIPIFFPFTLWETFLNCNLYDRELVVGAERLMDFTAKNYFPLKAFSPSLSHLSSPEVQTAIKKAAGSFTPDQVAQWTNKEFEFIKRKNKGKALSLVHDFYHAQVQLVLAANNENPNNNAPNSTHQKSPTPATSLQYVIAILDKHIKTMVAKANVGTAEQKAQTKEWNAQESQFLSVIKAKLNQ